MNLDKPKFEQAQSNAIEQWKICMNDKDKSWYIDEPLVKENGMIYGKIFLIAPYDRHCFGQILECMLNWNYIDEKGVFSIDFPPLLFTKFGAIKHINMISNQNQMQWSKFPNDKENDLTEFLPEIIDLVFPKDIIKENNSISIIRRDDSFLRMQNFWSMYSKKSVEIKNNV